MQIDQPQGEVQVPPKIVNQAELDDQVCEECWKDKRICICAQMTPANNKIQVLVLQHPREAANPWGTARLTSLGLKNSVHRVGLSWRTLSVALASGKQKHDPKDWAVLFLGTRASAPSVPQKNGVTLVRKVGKEEVVVPHKNLKGIVLLDGNWKQSKTLWWRNAWLLKLNRLLLQTPRVSRYGEIRRQPRKGCLSTIEAASECLSLLGESEGVGKNLDRTLDTFLVKLRQLEGSL
jgi:DTW domain-containing protein YfiP